MVFLVSLASPDPAAVLVIVDVRPKLNAVANQTKGKGYEPVGAGTNYPHAALYFMNGASTYPVSCFLYHMRCMP
jgi:hypothetical protein